MKTKEKFCKSIACKSDKIQKDVIYLVFHCIFKTNYKIENVLIFYIQKSLVRIKRNI